MGALLWLLTLLVSIPQFLERGSVQRSLGWSHTQQPPPFRVTQVAPGGPAQGILEPGDIILSIDGTSSYSGRFNPSIQIRSYPLSKPYLVKFTRRGVVSEAQLRIASRPSSNWPVVFSFLFGSLTFAAISWLMGWQRPDSLTARLGWLASQLTAFSYLNLALHISPSQGWQPSFLESSLLLIADWHLWLTFCFLSEFPSSRPQSPFWRAWRTFLTALCLLEWILVTGIFLPLLGSITWFNLQPLWWLPLTSYVQVACQAILGASMLAVLVRNYRTATDSDSRRRLEWVAGVIAFAVCFAAVGALIANSQNRPIPVWANSAPLLIPLCFAYAVVKHQVLDLRLVLRRSLKYLLARQLLRTLTLLPLALIVIRAIADPTAPIGSLFNLAGVALVCAAALALEFRQAIQNKLDRWYMRDILDREKRLRSLLAEIASMDSAQDLEQAVLARLKQIFDVENNPNSDEPITIAERELLDLVASQVQLVRDKFDLADQKGEAVLSERQRIAREIHDTVGHGFAGIALSLDAARKSSAEEADRLMQQASILARKSLRDTRESIAGLREPASLDLATRLQSLAEFPSVSVRLEEGAAGRANSEACWHLARIAEEAVTNARKHASARAIRVELEVSAGQLVLHISDDGIGFNTSSPASGYGLNGMRERMHVLNGNLKIGSTPGKGTQICAEVPL